MEILKTDGLEYLTLIGGNEKNINITKNFMK